MPIQSNTLRQFHSVIGRLIKTMISASIHSLDKSLDFIRRSCNIKKRQCHRKQLFAQMHWDKTMRIAMEKRFGNSLPTLDHQNASHNNASTKTVPLSLSDLNWQNVTKRSAPLCVNNDRLAVARLVSSQRNVLFAGTLDGLCLCHFFIFKSVHVYSFSVLHVGLFIRE